MSATITSFPELNALTKELFPEKFSHCDWTDGVIAIMGQAPGDVFLYRCGRDGTGGADTPAGHYTYYIVRDGDVAPQKMSDTATFFREPCSWDDMAAAMRRLHASPSMWNG